jgi:peptidoglycan-associated lipoprotein
MTISLSSRRAPFLALALVVGLAGCHHGGRPPALAGTPGGAGGASAPTETTPSQPTERINEGPDVRAVGGEGATGSDIAGGAAVDSGEGGPLADIRFELDSSTITEAARATLDQHAQWLKGHREARVTVEGHCDERGTVEYNLALGDQRARAARDYLVSLGIAADRLKSVSYGKERPLDPGTTEEAFAKNRRAHFAVGR